MALTTHESRVKVQEENKNKNNNSLPAIRLEWEQTSNGEVVSEIFDAVVIANGHYSMPNIPAIEGIQNFKGTVLHSVSYDSPEVFRGEIVLCIGGRASGSDLAREISRHAQHVFLSSSTVQSTMSHGNVTFVPKTLSIDEDGGIVFGKSCDVRPHVTTIIYCTGYDYSFPFINETSNLALAAEPELRCVMPLYKHLWHADYPNVSFIGIPTSVVPFPLFELQIEAVLQQIVTNGQNLPSRLERRLTAERDAQDGGHLQNGRIQDTHFLGNAQWAYCHDLASYAHIDCSDVSRFITTNQVSGMTLLIWMPIFFLIFFLKCFVIHSQRIYDHSHSVRSNGPSTSDSYREYVYVRDDSDTGFRILETPVEEK
jgi:Flavin-binding monooxygenase-like